MHSKIAFAAAAVAAPLAAAQDIPEVIQLDYRHEVTINGQTGLATATGFINRTTGIIDYTGLIDDLIPGYGGWPVSWLTLIITGTGPWFAVEQDLAVNLLDAANGNLAQSFFINTEDQFADLQTSYDLEFDGQTLFAVAVTQGTAQYPDIIGADSPLVFEQIPDPDGTVETFEKRLLTDGGRVIIQRGQTFFPGVFIPFPQERTARVAVLSQSEDGLQVRLRVAQTVEPADDDDDACNAADIARTMGEFGTLDGNDIALFVRLFLAGCPDDES